MRSEQRAITSYQEVWGSGGEWTSGRGPTTRFSVEQAIAVGCVFASVDLIAGSIASMPLQAFRDKDGIREKSSTTPQLLVAPSTVFALDEWIYAAVASLLLWGNAYGLIESYGSNGWATGLEWQDPKGVTVERESGRLKYTIWGKVVPTDRVVHVRAGLILPGQLLGLSPIQQLPVTIRTAAEAARYELGWFTEGAHPSSVLMSDQKVNQEEARTIKERFVAAVRGKREPVVLGAGLKYTPIQQGPDQSGSSSVKKAIATEVANAFHIPPELVGGEAGSSMTYSNVEAWQRNLEVRATMPIYTRVERALSAQMPRPVYCRFNADAVVRTSLKERYEAHHLALSDRWKTTNEVRKLEDMPAVPDGDQLAQAAQQDPALTLQRLYLAVDAGLLSPEEARELANRAGAGLTGPPPEPPEPAAVPVPLIGLPPADPAGGDPDTNGAPVRARGGRR